RPARGEWRAVVTSIEGAAAPAARIDRGVGRRRRHLAEGPRGRCPAPERGRLPGRLRRCGTGGPRATGPGCQAAAGRLPQGGPRVVTREWPGRACGGVVARSEGPGPWRGGGEYPAGPACPDDGPGTEQHAASPGRSAHTDRRRRVESLAAPDPTN